MTATQFDLGPWHDLDTTGTRVQRCWPNGAVAAYLYWSGYRWCSWVTSPTGRRLDHRHDSHRTEALARAHADEVLGGYIACKRTREQAAPGSNP